MSSLQTLPTAGRWAQSGSVPAVSQALQTSSLPRPGAGRTPAWDGFSGGVSWPRTVGTLAPVELLLVRPQFPSQGSLEPACELYPQRGPLLCLFAREGL